MILFGDSSHDTIFYVNFFFLPIALLRVSWSVMQKEGNCEACGRWESLDPDHIIGRRYHALKEDNENIWYICRHCHHARHQCGMKVFLEEYPHLTPKHQKAHEKLREYFMKLSHRT